MRSWEHHLDGRRFWVDVAIDRGHDFHRSGWKIERVAAEEARVVTVHPAQPLTNIEDSQSIPTLNQSGAKVLAIGGTTQLMTNGPLPKSYEDALCLAVAFKIASGIAEQQTTGVFAAFKE